MIHFSNIVLFHRKQARLSRRGLADLAGVGKTIIYNLENGRGSIRLDTLQKILTALNITLEWSSPLKSAFVAADAAAARGAKAG